jgi:choline-sulfatase
MLGASAAGALLTTGSLGQASSPQPRRKNILLIMTDQHRPAALSINGSTPAHTPGLDALARSGMRFDHAYCTTPVCVPSRASLLTGLWTHDHGAVNNDTPWPYEHKTIAHYLNDVGYITALIGKMHFVDAQTHGFDYHLDGNDWIQYLGPKTQLYADEIGNHPNSGADFPEIDFLWKDSGDPWTGHVTDDGRKGATAVGGISKLEEKDHFESFVTRESIRFLKKYGNGPDPFLLVTSYLKPHGPFTPVQRFYLQYPADEMKLPNTWHKEELATLPKELQNSIEHDWLTPELYIEENAKRRMALYYAALAQMDDNVGKMLQALHDLGLDEDTIVLYTADHGEMLGDHGLWQKTVFYEQSVGVPLIVRVPRVTKPDTRSQTLVSLVDVVPTLLELCEVPIPAGLDGSSISADLRGPETTRDTAVFSEYGLRTKGAKAMIRHGDFKYVSYSHDSPDQMFNLKSDPEEVHNLAVLPQHAAKAQEMKAKLKLWHTPA